MHSNGPVYTVPLGQKSRGGWGVHPPASFAYVQILPKPGEYYGYLSARHCLVYHHHLGINVVCLLMLIQRTIVPFEELECGVKAVDIVSASYPRLASITVGGKTVPSMRIASCHNENILWNRLGNKISAGHVRREN